MANYILGFTGPRGSGKTLSAVWVALCAMRKGWKCYSNLRIKDPVKSHESERLVPEELADSLETMDRCILVIDEIHVVAGSERYMSAMNRMLYLVMTQSRKRQINLVFTTQNMWWVDSRLRFLTDAEIQCRDLAYSPWGREQKVKPGEVISWTAFDRSGVFTQAPPDHLPVLMGRYTLVGKPLWECYDSYETIELWQAFARYEVDRPVVGIGFSQVPGFIEQAMEGSSGSGDEDPISIDHMRKRSSKGG